MTIISDKCLTKYKTYILNTRESRGRPRYVFIMIKFVMYKITCRETPNLDKKSLDVCKSLHKCKKTFFEISITFKNIETKVNLKIKYIPCTWNP